MAARHTCPVLRCTQNSQHEAEKLRTEACAANYALASCRRQWSACKQDSAAIIPSTRGSDISDKCLGMLLISWLEDGPHTLDPTQEDILMCRHL